MIAIEKLLANYLKNVAEVRAVVTPAEDRSTPWVRITMIGAPSSQTSQTDYLLEYLVQLDCYAGADGGQPEARDLAIEVRDLLHAMPQATFEDAVVTRVKFGSVARIPDPDFEPARERVVMDALITAHPIEGGS